MPVAASWCATIGERRGARQPRGLHDGIADAENRELRYKMIVPAMPRTPKPRVSAEKPLARRLR
jgi:hypothetical protein